MTISAATPQLHRMQYFDLVNTIAIRLFHPNRRSFIFFPDETGHWRVIEKVLTEDWKQVPSLDGKIPVWEAAAQPGDRDPGPVIMEGWSQGNFAVHDSSQDPFWLRIPVSEYPQRLVAPIAKLFTQLRKSPDDFRRYFGTLAVQFEERAHAIDAAWGYRYHGSVFPPSWSDALTAEALIRPHSPADLYRKQTEKAESIRLGFGEYNPGSDRSFIEFSGQLQRVIWVMEAIYREKGDTDEADRLALAVFLDYALNCYEDQKKAEKGIQTRYDKEISILFLKFLESKGFNPRRVRGSLNFQFWLWTELHIQRSNESAKPGLKALDWMRERYRFTYLTMEERMDLLRLGPSASFAGAEEKTVYSEDALNALQLRAVLNQYLPWGADYYDNDPNLRDCLGGVSHIEDAAPWDGFNRLNRDFLLKMERTSFDVRIVLGDPKAPAGRTYAIIIGRLSRPGAGQEEHWVELTPQLLGSLRHYDLVRGPDGQMYLVDDVLGESGGVRLLTREERQLQTLSIQEVTQGGWHYWVDGIDPDQGTDPGYGLPANADPEVVGAVIELFREGLFQDNLYAEGILREFLNGDIDFTIAFRQFSESRVYEGALFADWLIRHTLLLAWIAAEYRLPLKVASIIAVDALKLRNRHPLNDLAASVWQKYALLHEYEREWLARDGIEFIHTHAVRVAEPVRVEQVESSLVRILNLAQEAEESGNWDFVENDMFREEHWAVLAVMALPGPAHITVSEKMLAEYVRQLIRVTDEGSEADSFLDQEMVRRAFMAACAKIPAPIPKEILQAIQNPRHDPQYTAAVRNLAAVGIHLARRALTSLRESAVPDDLQKIVLLSNELRGDIDIFLSHMVEDFPDYEIWHRDLLVPYLENIGRDEVSWMGLDDVADCIQSLLVFPVHSPTIYLRGSQGVSEITSAGRTSLNEIRGMLVPLLSGGWIRSEEYIFQADRVLVFGDHALLPGEEVLGGDEAVTRISGASGVVFLRFPDELMVVSSTLQSNEPLEQDPHAQWHFEHYGDVWVVRPVGPITPEAKNAFVKKVGGHSLLSAGAEEKGVTVEGQSRADALTEKASVLRPGRFSGNPIPLRGALTPELAELFFREREGAESWLVPVDAKLPVQPDVRVFDQVGIPAGQLPRNLNYFNLSRYAATEVTPDLLELGIKDGDVVILRADQVTPEGAKNLIPEGIKARVVLLTPLMFNQMSARQLLFVAGQLDPGETLWIQHLSYVTLKSQEYLLIAA